MFPTESGTGRILQGSAALSIAACACLWVLPARGEPPALGLGSRATPGYVRVPVAAAGGSEVALAGGMGYGFTEAQPAAPGAHHRMQGRLAGGFAPVPWLNLSAATNLRHDRHGADAIGTDSGTVIDSDVYVLAGHEPWPEWHLGVGLGGAFVRGDGAGSAFANPAVDVHALAAFVPESSPLSVGMLVGYRYDRTAASFDAARYRAGDRIALGVSEFDAVPFGLGARYAFARAELLAELSGDVLVGAGAPSPVHSPVRASAGARLALSDAFSLRFVTDTLLTSRAPVEFAERLLPIEPRFQASFGLSYRFREHARAEPAPPPPIVAPPLRTAVEPAAASLVVKVTTTGGEPLSDARVSVVMDDRVIDVPHVALDTYRLETLPPGAGVLRVSADRLASVERPLRAEPGSANNVAVQLEPAASTAQIRGLVRSFDGRRLSATIRIEPLGLEVTSDATGSFLLDVPPGRYEVVIHAPRHLEQRRKVEVARDGVVILNADLARGGAR